MKLNIAYPATGCQKLIEIEDDRKLRVFFDKKMAQEVPGDSLGDEWKVWFYGLVSTSEASSSLPTPSLSPSPSPPYTTPLLS